MNVNQIIKKNYWKGIDDETTEYENLKVILMSRIRSPTGIDLNELKNGDYIIFIYFFI